MDSRGASNRTDILSKVNESSRSPQQEIGPRSFKPKYRLSAILYHHWTISGRINATVGAATGLGEPALYYLASYRDKLTLIIQTPSIAVQNGFVTVNEHAGCLGTYGDSYSKIILPRLKNSHDRASQDPIRLALQELNSMLQPRFMSMLTNIYPIIKAHSLRVPRLSGHRTIIDPIQAPTSIEPTYRVLCPTLLYMLKINAQ
ncbi:hypothetical protein M434DRAFT_28215 [Hypoxylon sp. CO27-5]|nr:hypothetical protein M434DRAFT_28215 [Hypoxylon sp. CO27-5]